ncbi:hypothetical protein [Chondromyces apiculatus]|uniref:Uncharacterized protein n=1 Tax=Chondromyces apiculatus DSM 436 TaxID=1192034 RepID=A0A017TEY9_9BACT|nr:hypothetical protein [Chondromyces apiculatus]EYF07472.1 Hypothetical protein CAP_0225 [Chondromyces apiculatus DSM 436]
MRSLARVLGIHEDDLLLWLEEHAPAKVGWHPASFVPAETARRAREQLGPPAPRAAEPSEPRCADCMGHPAAGGVRLVPADATHACAVCNGSVNRRAALAMVAAFHAHGLCRLLVIGGGPGTAEELRALLADHLEIRIVDGESHRNAAQAEAELRWASVVAVWSSTILPHKVSKLYTDSREFRDKLVTVPRRGVAALCQLVAGRVNAWPRSVG